MLMSVIDEFFKGWERDRLIKLLESNKHKIKYLITKRISWVDCRRKQSMAWHKYHSKDTRFRWKIKWRLELLGALGIMGET